MKSAAPRRSRSSMAGAVMSCTSSRMGVASVPRACCKDMRVHASEAGATGRTQ
ncbi:hypothetical protein WJ977_11435 [Achromobacter xylosoxidans]